MPDSAPDSKQKRSGPLWYAKWGLFVYVLSFTMFVVVVNWVDRRVALPPEVAAVLNIVYWPIIRLLNDPRIKDLIFHIADLFTTP